MAVEVSVNDPGRTSGEGVADNERVPGEKVCEVSGSVVISVMIMTAAQRCTVPSKRVIVTIRVKVRRS